MEPIENYAFVHGGSQGSWVWDETIEALISQAGSRPIRTLALDVPGCGTKRGRGTSQLGAEDVASELISDLERANLKDLVLVGHSLAGTLLPLMAAAKPQLFKRLIYISCSAPLPGQSVRTMMGSCIRGSNKDEVEWPLDPKIHDIQSQLPVMFGNDMNQEQLASFMSQLGEDQWPEQVSLKVRNWRYDHLDATPSSYVVCLKDNILPVHWQEEFARRFRSKRLVKIDAGHQAMNTRPQAIAEILNFEASQPLAG
jgi:pimeloyl-ACP methyl ester carboxylesterase